MKYLILLVFLCGTTVNADVFKNTKIDYDRIVKVNKIKNAPKLQYLLKDLDPYDASYDCPPNKIYLNLAMLQFVRSRSEMAIVVGHELAHAVYHHCGDYSKNVKDNWRTELMADKLGMLMAKRAGFNVCKGVKVLQAFHMPDSGTHPSSNYRYKLLKCNKSVK